MATKKGGVKWERNEKENGGKNRMTKQTARKIQKQKRKSIKQ
jgi:hypothetical protein